MKKVAVFIAIAIVAAACSGGRPPGGTNLGGIYVRAGNRILLVWSQPSAFDTGIIDFGRPTIHSVQLRNVNADTFRVVDDSYMSYATDGRNFWCNERDPIATFNEVRKLGRGYFDVRGSVQRECRQLFVVDATGPQPVMAESFSQLPCGVLRAGVHLYVLGAGFNTRKIHGQTLEPIDIRDPPTFTINDKCAGSDSHADYRFDETEESRRFSRYLDGGPIRMDTR